MFAFLLLKIYLFLTKKGNLLFNKRFIELIVKQPVNDSIKKYGIGIFMTLTACCNFLNISQISLGKKTIILVMEK